MNSLQEKAVQKLSDEILNALGNLSDYETLDDKRQYFKEATEDALKRLTKDEIIDILSFVIIDYELFFDVFEESIARSKNAPKDKS